METLSDEIIQLLAIFAVAFTAPTFAKSVPLVIGAILSPGRRTVAAALRMVGLDDDLYDFPGSRSKGSPALDQILPLFSGTWARQKAAVVSPKTRTTCKYSLISICSSGPAMPCPALP